MDLKTLEKKIAEYTAQISKTGNLSLLSKVKKAQEEANIAAEEARDLYKKFIKSKKHL